MQKNGRYVVPGDSAKITVQASVQPYNGVQQTFEGGAVGLVADKTIYVMGSTTVAIGDVFVDSKGTEYRVTSIDQDWRDYGNYQKLTARMIVGGT